MPIIGIGNAFEIEWAKRERRERAARKQVKNSQTEAESQRSSDAARQRIAGTPQPPSPTHSPYLSSELEVIWQPYRGGERGSSRRRSVFTCKIAAIPIWFELRFFFFFFVSQNRIPFACVCVTRVRVCVCERYLSAILSVIDGCRQKLPLLLPLPLPLPELSLDFNQQLKADRVSGQEEAQAQLTTSDILAALHCLPGPHRHLSHAHTRTRTRSWSCSCTSASVTQWGIFEAWPKGTAATLH